MRDQRMRGGSEHNHYHGAETEEREEKEIVYQEMSQRRKEEVKSSREIRENKDRNTHNPSLERLQHLLAFSLLSSLSLTKEPNFQVSQFDSLSFRPINLTLVLLFLYKGKKKKKRLRSPVHTDKYLSDPCALKSS